MANVFVSTFPFCRTSSYALDILKKNGHTVTINPLGRKMKPNEVAEFAQEHDTLIAGTEDLLPLVEKSSSLKLISRVGVGLDSVPLDLCKDKGIAVTYTPDAVSPAVSELAIGLMIDLFRQVGVADRELRSGGWSRPYGIRIGTSKIGILGCGRIGTRLAYHLLGLAPAEILICDIVDKSDFIDELRKNSESLYQSPFTRSKNWSQTKIRQVSHKELYTEADCISVHIPLNDTNRNLISSQEIKQMKPSSYLINTARAGIINEEDIYQCLVNGTIAGAAIDVFEEEPYHGKLTNLDNVILTQHMGSCSIDCREDMEKEASDNVVGFFRGEQLEARVV
jgi:D-3-phosphoglycerate dehydrogenase / 2-oxoglutarate reductase